MTNTLATLKSDLQNYRKGSDLEAFWPRLIALAEERLFADLDITEEEKTFTGDITSGTLTLPTDFNEQRSLRLDQYTTQPRYRTPQKFAIESNFVDSNPGTPMIYTVFGREVTIWPLPDKTTNAVIQYVSFPAPLTQDTDTNDVLENHYSAYLYGALIETEPFVGNDPRMGTWAAMYDEAIHRKNKNAKRQRFPSGDLKRSANVRARRRIWPTAKSSGAP